MESMNHPKCHIYYFKIKSFKNLGTGLVYDPAYIVGRITLVRLGLVK